MSLALCDPPLITLLTSYTTIGITYERSLRTKEGHGSQMRHVDANNKESATMQRSRMALGSPLLSRSRNSQQALAPFTMRAIGLVIAFLHPRHQSQPHLRRQAPKRQHHFQQAPQLG